MSKNGTLGKVEVTGETVHPDYQGHLRVVQGGDEKLSAPPAEAPKRKRFSFRFPIAAKFQTLILFTLAAAVISLVFNALILFKKENTSNIYTSSDLLTQAKAAEVNAWILSIKEKANFFHDIFSSNQKISDPVPNDRQTVAFLKFNSKNKILIEWLNPKIRDFKLSQLIPYLEKETNFPPPTIKLGRAYFSTSILPNGTPILIYAEPVKQNNGKSNASVLMITKMSKVIETFTENEPYTLFLANDLGKIIAHPKTEVIKKQNLTEIHPLVRSSLKSDLNREFKEFQKGDEEFFGAYARVGVTHLVVVSEISKERALEVTQSLVRRSALLGIFVFSIALILAIGMTNSFIGPLRTLQGATEKIASGDFDVNVEIQTQDEVGDLADRFNDMSSEILSKFRNLRQINEAGKNIAATLDLDLLMNLSIQKLHFITRSSSAIGWAWQSSDLESSQFVPRKVSTIGWDADPQASLEEFLEPKYKEAFFSSEPALVRHSQYCDLVIPIHSKEKAYGAIILRKKDPDEFTKDELLSSNALSTNIAVTMNNIGLLEETAEKARMGKELETAKLVQETMFPPEQVDLGGMFIESYYTPASECGGDWWGYFKLPNDRVLLAIADATGHGVSAALITSAAKSAFSMVEQFSAYDADLAKSPERILELLNRSIHDSSKGTILMTFFLASIDLRTGEMRYASASHDPIFWYHMPESPEEKPNKSQLDILDVDPGYRLGKEADSRYQGSDAQLSPGDFIYLYTDGIIEGLDHSGKEYGDRRFRRTLVKVSHSTPGEAKETIISDFNKFVGDTPLEDDVTLVVCKYKGSGG